MSRESEIIQRAAAEFIHDRHRLGAFVGGLLRDAHTAEDVIQEVWVRLAAEGKKAPPSKISLHGVAVWRGIVSSRSCFVLIP